MADPQSLAKGLMATEPVMRAYEPSWRDRMAAALMGDGRVSPARSQVVMGLLGSRGLGSTGLSAIDATPAGAVLDMQQAAQHGDRAGMALAAAGMVPGAKVAEKVAAKVAEAAPVAKYIDAYHASPHDYERVDLSKIGTGEGNQVFGHGYYAAESPAVSGRGGAYDKYFQEKTGKPAHIYEVRIHADPEHFLDWDKPYSQQSPQVQKNVARALADRGLPLDETGTPTMLSRDPKPESIHASMLAFQDPNQGAKQFVSSGIPGIKYLDQGSRGAGEGSRNYVVFDDKIIEIMRKYGLAGSAGAAMAAEILARENGGNGQTTPGM